MTTIGLSIIVSDRHEELEHCLEAAQGLYDYLSITLVKFPTAKTKKCEKVARKHNAIITVYKTAYNWKHHFIDDFAAARNLSWRALPKDCTWVVCLDSDDLIQDAKEVREKILKYETPSLCLVTLMNSHKDGAFLQPRIWSKGDCFWRYRMHEQLIRKNEDVVQMGDRSITIIHDYDYDNPDNREVRNNTLAKEIIKSGDPNLRFSFFYAEKLYINQMKQGFKKTPKLDEAMEIFKKVIGEGVGKRDSIIVFKSYYFLADYYSISEERNYLKSIRYGLDALKQNLDDGRPYFTIGRALYSMKHYEQAIVWLEHAMNLPDSLGPFPIFNAFKTYLPIEQIAFCYKHMGEKEKAQGYHSRARFIHKEYEAHDKEFE